MRRPRTWNFLEERWFCARRCRHGAGSPMSLSLLTGSPAASGDTGLAVSASSHQHQIGGRKPPHLRALRAFPRRCSRQRRRCDGVLHCRSARNPAGNREVVAARPGASPRAAGSLSHLPNRQDPPPRPPSPLVKAKTLALVETGGTRAATIVPPPWQRTPPRQDGHADGIGDCCSHCGKIVSLACTDDR